MRRCIIRFETLVPRAVLDPRKLQSRRISVNVVVVGKKGGIEPWIGAGVDEYEKRLKSSMNINTTVLKSNNELEQFETKMKGPIFAMDERGSSLTSKEFSQLLYGSLQEGGASVSFIIGEPDFLK